MKENIKSEWVKRLRSGKYEQATASLYRSMSNTYCCLGVLCEIAVEHGVIHKGDATYFYEDRGERVIENTELPLPVMRWAEMKSRNGAILDTTLTDCNDALGYDFDQIADLIEDHWKHL